MSAAQNRRQKERSAHNKVRRALLKLLLLLLWRFPPSLAYLELPLSDLGEAGAASDPAHSPCVADHEVRRSELSPRVQQEACGRLLRQARRRDIVQGVRVAMHQRRWRCRGAHHHCGVDDGVEVLRRLLLLLLPHRRRTTTEPQIKSAFLAARQAAGDVMKWGHGSPPRLFFCAAASASRA